MKRVHHSRVNCPFCDREFAKRSIPAHLLVHTKEKPFSCSLCDKTYAQSSTLQTHMFVHTGERIFKCNTCPKTFQHRNALKYHEGTHSSNRETFQCSHPNCGKYFKSVTNLKNHVATLRLAYSARPFGCDICEKRFTKTTDYHRHITNHTGEKAFKCEICGKCFSSHHSLHVHQKGHGPRQFECKLCLKSFVLKRTLKWHTRHIHENPTKSRKFQIRTSTGQVFVNKAILKIASEDKSFFQCSLCLRQLKDRGTAVRHVKTVHDLDKEHECPHCPFKTNFATNLKVHMRSHTGEMTFQCVFCPYQVRQHSSFYGHIRGHTREKPHFCEMCEETFVDKTRLDCHFRLRHTLERPFKCEQGECAKAYASSASLWTHQKKRRPFSTLSFDGF